MAEKLTEESGGANRHTGDAFPRGNGWRCPPFYVLFAKMVPIGTILELVLYCGSALATRSRAPGMIRTSQCFSAPHPGPHHSMTPLDIICCALAIGISWSILSSFIPIENWIPSFITSVQKRRDIRGPDEPTPRDPSGDGLTYESGMLGLPSPTVVRPAHFQTLRSDSFMRYCHFVGFWHLENWPQRP